MIFLHMNIFGFLCGCCRDWENTLLPLIHHHEPDKTMQNNAIGVEAVVNALDRVSTYTVNNAAG